MIGILGVVCCLLGLVEPKIPEEPKGRTFVAVTAHITHDWIVGPQIKTYPGEIVYERDLVYGQGYSYSYGGRIYFFIYEGNEYVEEFNTDDPMWPKYKRVGFKAKKLWSIDARGVGPIHRYKHVQE